MKVTGLDNFTLKCIAIITMAVDHTGAILFPGEEIFRIIGRISFPLFCFLIATGFYYTGNLRKYIGRILVFALIAEIPYDLAFYRVPVYSGRQNVLFTFAIALCALTLMTRLNQYWSLLIVPAAMGLAWLIRCDYSYMGVLLVILFYYTRSSRGHTVAAAILWSLAYIPQIQMYSAVSALPLALHNHQRGYRIKYFFYIFYPLHLLILYLISRAAGV